MISPNGAPAVTLDPWKYQDPRWCANCGGMQTVIAIYETDFGRAVLCMGCGDEKFLEFSRVTGVAA